MWQVLINGVDRTSLVESVDLNSAITEGASAQIYTILGMPEIAAFSPIVINMDGVTVFKGYVGAPEEVWYNGTPGLFSAKYACYDEGTGFMNILVSGAYSGPADQVLEQLTNKYASGYDLKVESGINMNINLTFDYTTLSDCYDQIAGQVSCNWFVTPQDEIYFFTTTTAAIDGSTTTLGIKDVQTPYNHRKATDKVVNEVTVIGGEAVVTMTSQWTYNGSQSVFSVPEPIATATVTWNGAPVYLVPEGFSGDPYTPSDKDAANTASSDPVTGNRSPSAITHVIVHHIAAVSATKADLYQWHVVERGWSDIGYHWYIHKDGTVEACRPELKTGAHAKGHNSYTIGIACEGDYERADTAMPKAQFNALVAKILDVMTRYKMDRNHLMYHCDVSSTSCPGKYFPKNDVINAVKNGNATNYSYTTSPTPVTDGTNKMYINYSDQAIKVIPTFEPPNGTVIKITYETTYMVMDTQRSSQPLSNYGGRIIPKVIADASIVTKEDARKQALALLAKFQKIEETLELDLISYKNIFAGDKIVLSWLGKTGVVTSTSSRLYLKTSADNNMKIEVTLL